MLRAGGQGAAGLKGLVKVAIDLGRLPRASRPETSNGFRQGGRVIAEEMASRSQGRIATVVGRCRGSKLHRLLKGRAIEPSAHGS